MPYHKNGNLLPAIGNRQLTPTTRDFIHLPHGGQRILSYRIITWFADYGLDVPYVGIDFK